MRWVVTPAGVGGSARPSPATGEGGANRRAGASGSGGGTGRVDAETASGSGGSGGGSGVSGIKSDAMETAAGSAGGGCSGTAARAGGGGGTTGLAWAIGVGLETSGAGGGSLTAEGVSGPGAVGEAVSPSSIATASRVTSTGESPGSASGSLGDGTKAKRARWRPTERVAQGIARFTGFPLLRLWGPGSPAYPRRRGSPLPPWRAGVGCGPTLSPW